MADDFGVPVITQDAPVTVKENISVPIVKETVTKQTMYPMNSVYDRTGKPNKNNSGAPLNCAEQINIMAEKQSTDYKVEIVRKSPAITFDGIKLRLGPCFNFNSVLPLNDIQDAVKQLHGGGRYQLRLLNSGNVQINSMNFEIDGDPIPNEEIELHRKREAMSQSMGTSNGTFNPFKKTAQTPEDDELVKIAKMERINVMSANNTEAEIKRIKAEEKKLEAEKQMRKNQNSDEESRLAREERTLQDSIRREDRERDERIRREEKAQEDKARREKDEREDRIRREDRENNTTLQLITAALNKPVPPPPDNGLATIMTAMMKQNEIMMQISQQNMQAQSQMFTTLITAMTAQKPNNSSEEILKEIVKSSSLATLEANKKADKLIELVLTKKLDSGDQLSNFNNMLDFVDRVRGDDGGEVINPEAGFMSNFGNVLLKGVSGLISGGMKGIGPAIMQGLAQQGAPQQPQYMLPAPQQQFLPAPQPQPQQPQYQPQQGATFEPQPQQQPMPQQQYQPPQQQQQQPQPQPNIPPQDIPLAISIDDPVNEEQVQQTQTVQAVQATQTREILTVTDTEEAARLQDYVNATITIMLTDLKDGRREHEWTDYAINKFSKSFLDALVTCQNDAARLDLFKNNADPALFAQLHAYLTDSKNYAIWLHNLHMVLKEYLNPASNVIPIAS